MRTPVSLPRAIPKMLVALLLTLRASPASSQVGPKPSTNIACGTPSAPGTCYIVSMASHDRRSVRVRAHIVLTDTLLLMYPEGADHVPDSWATFVRDLVATDGAGNVLPLRSLGHAQWSVPTPRPATLDLSYEVLIHHDAGQWPFGSKEAAFARDDATFLTGKALFITQYAMADVRVRWDLPAEWKLATPWGEVLGTPNTYRVKDVYELLEVGMMVGRHIQRTTTMGDVSVTLAVGHDLEQSVTLLEQTVQPIIAAAARIFAGTPPGKFVVIANRDSYDGGTTFTRSFDVVFKTLPDLTNRDNWGHVVTHEMLHLWNGLAIRTGDQAQEYWFSEGFTDYLANLIETRTGMITRERFFSRLGEHIDKYNALAGTVSLRKAGDDKAKYYDLVYSGGLLAAFALDMEIRARTEGRRSLDDVMRAMYRDFSPPGRTYVMSDVVREASGVAGADLSGFFSAYVEGRERLPVDRALASLGRRAIPLNRAPMTRIWLDPRRSRLQRAREDQLLGGPAPDQRP